MGKRGAVVMSAERCMPSGIALRMSLADTRDMVTNTEAWASDPIERAFRAALAQGDMVGVRTALLAAERRDQSQHATGEPADLHLVEWDHPHLGRLGEVVCPVHEGRLLAALDFLGIGCVGRRAPADLTCLRCRWGGQARDFLRIAVIGSIESGSGN